jgi:hypothetical protein
VSTPEFNEDFVDVVVSFLEQGVEFVVVGAYALAAHGYPRATGDIDLFVRPSPENASRVYRALLQFGAPVVAHGVGEEDFRATGHVYQIGLPPRRIDILTSISGVTFDEALEGAMEGRLGPCTVRFIGRAAMRKNKLASGRAKDLARGKPTPAPWRHWRRVTPGRISYLRGTITSFALHWGVECLGFALTVQCGRWLACGSACFGTLGLASLRGNNVRRDTYR